MRTMEDKEIWKDIPGWEGLYQASTHGRIRSIPGYVIGKDGKPHYKIGGIRSLHTTPTCKYYVIVLSRKRKFSNHLVHILVAKTFIPNPQNKKEVNHKDGNRFNNRVDNLEWCTARENYDHAIRTGLKNDSGENNSRAAFTKDQVISMRERYANGERISDIAKDYGFCSEYTVRMAIVRKTYKNIP